jgi:hypothetical protein
VSTASDDDPVHQEAAASRMARLMSSGLVTSVVQRDSSAPSVMKNVQVMAVSP